MRVEAQRRTGARAGGLPYGVLLVGLVIGLILGLLWAWVVQPVEVRGVSPDYLSATGQRMWVEMTADALALTGDETLAELRMSPFTAEQQATLLGAAIEDAREDADLAREQRLVQLADTVGVTPGTAPGAEAAPAGGGLPIATICGVALLLLVLLVGGAIFVTRKRGLELASARPRTTSRNRAAVGAPVAAPTQEEIDQPVLDVPAREETTEVGDEELDRLFDDADEVVEEDEQVREIEFAEPEATPVRYSPALDEFVTRYNYGDDGYDMSFSIETPQTEFLGECGVGISEVVNEGSPQQATAFEVWLFDKDDIRTVTKVLLSDYAWDNEELRSRLAPKGELIHVREGDTLDLETKSLRVRARIREIEYGESGPGENSYFERLVVELTPQQKT